MKKMILAGLACIVLLVICTAGCVVNSDDIVGTWYSEDGYYDSGVYYDLKYVFESDGTGSEYWYISNNGYLDDVYDFTWKTEGDGKYVVSYDGYSSYYDETFYLAGSKLFDDYDVTYYKG